MFAKWAVVYGVFIYFGHFISPVSNLRGFWGVNFISNDFHIQKVVYGGLDMKTRRMSNNDKIPR